MKLVIDMNLSTDWVPALQAANIEAVHWATMGAPEADDQAIMAWAQANDAVVLTRDLDFAAMLMSSDSFLPAAFNCESIR